MGGWLREPLYSILFSRTGLTKIVHLFDECSGEWRSAQTLSEPAWVGSVRAAGQLINVLKSLQTRVIFVFSSSWPRGLLQFSNAVWEGQLHSFTVVDRDAIFIKRVSYKALYKAYLCTLEAWIHRRDSNGGFIRLSVFGTVTYTFNFICNELSTTDAVRKWRHRNPSRTFKCNFITI